ncbi:heavy-metal-associated domain-containing protein [Thermotoga sp. SG1]|uniref:heavy-metal-associated domain-containing protein n=1 Tax=Thermotoga sp. SG1 TaxID=126739 RepID=UPI0018EC68D3|nr:heavy-metal-associated domain-containing protein [Thermotoga sp. SG1]
MYNEKIHGENSEEFLLKGLNCPKCAARIQKEVSNLPGIKSVNLDFATGKLKISGYDVDVKQIEKIVKNIEPSVKVQRETKDPKESNELSTQRPFIVGALMFIFSITVFEFKLFDFPEWFRAVIYILSYLFTGWEILRAAIVNITKGQIFDENFLMTVATVGALFIKQFPEAVSVMIFYKIGEMLQEKAVDRSRRSIEKLMDIKPEYANLKVWKYNKTSSSK